MAGTVLSRWAVAVRGLRRGGWHGWLGGLGWWVWRDCMGQSGWGGSWMMCSGWDAALSLQEIVWIKEERSTDIEGVVRDDSTEIDRKKYHHML